MDYHRAKQKPFHTTHVKYFFSQKNYYQFYLYIFEMYTIGILKFVREHLLYE